MPADLTASIVAILNPDGAIAGTGFVISPTHALTCAHVISDKARQPGGIVRVRFHSNGQPRNAIVSEEFWRNPDADDIAVLMLDGALPASVEPLSFSASDGKPNQYFHSFGYPALGGGKGVDAYGRIVSVSRDPGKPVLFQLDSEELAQGFSGAPIVDKDSGRVIGMVQAVINSGGTGKLEKVAYATPLETLSRVLPSLISLPTSFWPLGHAYATSPHFTGRRDERKLLSAWLRDGPPVLSVRALGGFGKSALAWHWLLNDVNQAQWPRALWWNFYDVREFDSFLAETLPHFGVDPRGLGPRQQADELLKQLAQPGTLLILDGFERALRAFQGMDAAYRGDDVSPSPDRAVRSGEGAGGWGNERDCLSPTAEHFLRGAASRPGLRGRVLLTTRLRPRVLEGHGHVLLVHCREYEINALSPADAVEFFHTQEIKGTRAEIESACAPYGYHPLSLRLLAGLIVSDLRQPGDIAAAGRLDVSGDLVQRQHHVLEQSYERLSPTGRELLGLLACFRNPLTFATIQAVWPPPLPAGERRFA